MGGASGLDALTSLDGTVGKVSSFGSTTDTLSGSGFLGPVLPLGSQGNMILTLIPNTPENNRNDSVNNYQVRQNTDAVKP